MASIQEQPRLMYNSLYTAFVMVIVIWVIEIFQLIAGMDFGVLGLYPREWFGLRGILFAPLIHSDFGHLISNSVPLFVLTTTIFFFYRRVAVRSFIMIYFLTGLTVWLFGRSVFHIGASGVVYGLVAFVFWNGIFRKNVKSIVLALIVVILYHGMFEGILPTKEGISWESHLFGAFVGIFTSYFYKEELEADEQPKPDPFADEVPQAQRPYFLPRDTFEMTKQERAQQEWLRQQQAFRDTFGEDTPEA